MTASTVGTAASTKSHAGRRATTNAVFIGKIAFIVCLSMVAAVLGFTATYLLTGAERRLAEKQFSSIADRAIQASLAITSRKRLGTISMASIAANANPEASNWPFVTIDGYETIATNIIETSSGREMGFAPFVEVDELAEFEQFAYKFYQQDRKPEPFPNGTALSPFGEGVWGLSNGTRYHETDGSTYYGSPNRFFAPILHHNAGAFPALMINLRFQETRGIVIDDMVECAKRRAQRAEDVECGAITDMLILTSQEVEPGPGALLMQPIYPAYDPTVFTGIIASSIVWSEVLENIFAKEVSGIDCILKTESQVYTYYIENGVAYLKGEGDLHDKTYDRYRESKVLTGEGLFGDSSASYTLSLYPTEALFEVYSTDNPRTATIGAVLIILFTSSMFFLYDFFVRQEFNAKKDLLEAKRKFVRFVSHEVRTPLNSVCMGLTLMQEEISLALAAKGSTVEETGPTLPQKSGAISQMERGVDINSASEWLSLTEEIFVNAQSAVDVLNDLLNYDKVENGNLSLELTVIPIWNLIEMTVVEFKLPAAQKNISFELDYGTLLAKDDGESMAEPLGPTKKSGWSRDVQERMVVGDTVRITQVLRNLLSNALKFTKEGGKLAVHASWIKSNEEKGEKTASFVLKNGEEVKYMTSGKLQVSVKDSGAGMSKEQLSRLFSQGVQFNVNELQAGQGSGLGLFIAKGIMEQHGGTLVADSEGLGMGTTFTMTIPLYHVPSTRENQNDMDEGGRPYEDHSSAQMELMPMRILIVDDSSTNRKLLRRLLQNHGHECWEAENGEIATDMVQESIREGKRYDSILLDYEMPVMIGPVACQQMRKSGCDSFIIGITGNVMAEDVAMFKESGANAVLPKPFKLTELDQLWVEYGITGAGAVEA